MSAPIVHHQRVAWDGARAFVQAAQSAWCGWLADRLGAVLGSAYRQHLVDSRARLLTSTRPDAAQVEAGMWRARLDDALYAEPHLAAAVADLARQTQSRLRSWAA